MKHIIKYFKKKKLLAKYKQTDEKMLNDLQLLQLMKNDSDFKKYFLHQRYCELRCYTRLNKL